MRNKFIIIFILLTLVYADVRFSYNGKFSQFFALRNSDNKILNIPFRMLDLNTTMQLGYNFEVKSLLSAQYHNTIDDYFNTKNIIGEVRELYGTYYFDSGEISFGRKLFTLGSVDENSPIDHFNPYNYYYLLIGGLDKKVSVDAFSFEFYLGENYQISGAYSPNHNKNYYPESEDEDYELGLPEEVSDLISYDFLPIKGSQHESMLSLKKSNLNNEYTFTYTRAFDRIFSLSGIMAFKQPSATSYILENKYSYRLTESFSIGSIFLLNDLTIRSDLAFFHSFDRNNMNDYMNLISKADMIFCESSFGCNDNLIPIYIADLNGQEDVPWRLPLNEETYYSQFNIQVEIPLPNDWQINMQFFKYNLDKYNSTSYLDSDIDLPMAQLAAGGFFFPGFGSSMGTLSEKSLLIGFEKYMLDNNLKSNFTLFSDLSKGNGRLVSFELEYEISNNINLILGSTKIFGDSSIPENDNYTFNAMESFSHNRIQLNYYF